MNSKPIAASRPAPDLLKQASPQQDTVFRILLAISFVHLFNDSIQAVIPAIFPILKDTMRLSYGQIGWIAFAINFTASIMQPVVGYAADRRPTPALLPIGMTFTFFGVLLLALAPNYGLVLLAVILVGLARPPSIPKECALPIWPPDIAKALPNLFFRWAGTPGNPLPRC